MTYDEFEQAAMEIFGLEPYEAAVLAEQMAGQYDLDAIAPDDEDFWEDASEYEAVDMALEEYDEAPEKYELDPYFPDDDWLEPDVEWEMTAETDDSYMETA